MKVRVQRLSENAVLPQYSKIGDAGMDLVATSKEYDKDENVVYGTGLAVEIPEGYVGLLFPRSSNSKKDLVLTNHVGVVDSGYRGEVMMKFGKFRKRYKKALYDDYDVFHEEYQVGDRIGQIIILPYPQIEFEEAEELTETERGAGGYGSTGA